MCSTKQHHRNTLSAQKSFHKLFFGEQNVMIRVFGVKNNLAIEFQSCSYFHSFSTAVLVCALLSFLSSLHGCPKECSCNSNSKVVDCRGRGLYDIPRRLHPDTQELYLQDNRIRGIGTMAFREAPLVRIIDLSNNSITSVSPTALLSLRSLQRLSLAHNSLRELDRRLFGPIRSISHLDLSHNR